MAEKIKVLIVDDSIFMQRIFATGLATDELIQVVGFAADPFEAGDKIFVLQPDVIILDINMPKMNGIDFLKKLLPQYPVPVVAVSSNHANMQKALNAGAAFFIEKPGTIFVPGLFIKQMIEKVKKAISLRHENGNWRQVDITAVMISGYDAEKIGQKAVTYNFNKCCKET